MLKVKLTDNATATLKRLQAQGQDLTPALNDIGNALIQSTQTRFWDTKTDPSGKKWHELNPIYAMIKKKRGQKHGILIGEGSLVGGLVKEVTSNAVFTYNTYNGVIHEPNWQAIDILLKFEQVDVSPSDFNAYRHILAGFVDWVQGKQLEEMDKDG